MQDSDKLPLLSESPSRHLLQQLSIDSSAAASFHSSSLPHGHARLGSDSFRSPLLSSNRLTHTPSINPFEPIALNSNQKSLFQTLKPSPLEIKKEIDFDLWNSSRTELTSIYDPSAKLWDIKSRFLFYSEPTGLLESPRFELLDFTRFQKSLSGLLKESCFWIDICNPSNSELDLISRIFGIHPLTTEDILTPDTREKCEIFPNYYFICITTFDEQQLGFSYMQPINYYLIVFKECVLSFHFTDVYHARNVLKRITQLKEYGLQVTPDWINYALIDDITDAFFPILSSIDVEVESIDDLVLILKESEQSDMLRRIGQSRKKVMQLMKLLNTKSDILKVIINRCIEKMEFDSDTRFYLSDIQDHVIAMVQNLAQYEKTLGRAHSNYLAQISIEITQSSNRTSDVVMKMTAIASILVPLNVVTGLWGMNVKVPGQDEESLFWFFGIITGMVTLSLLLYYVVKKAELV